MAFCGKWVDGDDDFYDYSNMNAAELREEIDPELDEVMAITEGLESWEEEENEE